VHFFWLVRLFFLTKLVGGANFPPVRSTTGCFSIQWILHSTLLPSYVLYIVINNSIILLELCNNKNYIIIYNGIINIIIIIGNY
jgi:hypothetical protein